MASNVFVFCATVLLSFFLCGVGADGDINGTNRRDRSLESKVFDVRKYGAHGDGHHDDTKVFSSGHLPRPKITTIFSFSGANQGLFLSFPIYVGIGKSLGYSMLLFAICHRDNSKGQEIPHQACHLLWPMQV